MSQTIDSQWLTDNAAAFYGGNPYILGQPFSNGGNSYSVPGDGIYQLSGDVTCGGSGFAFAGASLTLDGGHHTLTYDNTAAPGVTNGGFETDSVGSTSITGWDVSGAAGAIIRSFGGSGNAAWLYGWWGSKLLEVPGVTVNTLATIKSSTFALPTVGVEYVAMIQPKITGASGLFIGSCTIEVVDSVSGTSLPSIYGPPGPTYGSGLGLGGGYGDGTTFDPTRGTLCYIQFVPTSVANPYYLRIAAGSTQMNVTIDFDHADVVFSRNVGVMAGPSLSALPAQLYTLPAISVHSSSNSAPTVRNLTIVQGSGRSWSGFPLYMRGASSPTADGNSITSSGGGIAQLHAINGENLTVTNNTLVNNMDIIDERAKDYSAIDLGNAAGAVTVTGNSLSGSPHTAIFVSGGAYFTGTGVPSNITSCLIDGNTMSCNAKWTDSYGLAASGMANTTISNNTSIPSGGGTFRGMILDGYNGMTDGVTMHDNWFESVDQANLEYLPDSLEATGLRVRSGTIRNVHATNDTYVGHARSGGAWAGIGMRIDQLNGETVNGEDTANWNDSSDNLWSNCTFRAIIDSLDPGLVNVYAGNQAWAMTCGRVDHGTGLTFDGCTFDSNATPIAMGSDDGTDGSEYDILFLNCTIRMNTTDGLAPNSIGMRPFHSITLGDWGPNSSNNWFVDPTYANGAPAGFTFLGNKSCDASTGFLATVTVKNADGSNAVGATVTASSGGSQIWPYLNTAAPPAAATALATMTASDGTIPIPVPVTEYFSDGTSGENASPIVTTPYLPVTLHATGSGGATGSAVISSMSGDQSITITLSGGSSAQYLVLHTASGYLVLQTG